MDFKSCWTDSPMTTSFHSTRSSLWPVLTAVSVHGPLQILCFDLSVVRQRVICCLVYQGAQFRRTGSRRLACEFLQVEPFPRFLAELCFQNLHSRGFIRKIDPHSYVKSPFPN